ncbi:MAG: hypothetical protein KatS3mg110_0101 [Pirellulaceae bacterium]|nr:MAG: hypothetical protein KatS3mg110_0101 [Pirellulaceae bacterium]
MVDARAAVARWRWRLELGRPGRPRAAARCGPGELSAPRGNVNVLPRGGPRGGNVKAPSPLADQPAR